MKMMKILMKAEMKKLKRQRMIWVGYLSIVFSFIITLAQQLQFNSSSVVWRNMVDMFIYNNAVLFLPFSAALIGGYIIDREYSQDTLKNQLVVPIHWRNIIKAKVIVLFLLVIQLGILEIFVSLLTGIILGFDGITPIMVLKNVIHILVSNVCVTIGILPVILWFGKTRGKYVWGSILSMLIGVSGIFVINGRLANWHPVTAALSFTTISYEAANISDVVKSCIALAIYGLLSIVVYIGIFQKDKV
ncbi:MAG: ABC transporter permease subunit [Ruminococcus sp.]|jgi:ABC-type transport system involved in multi-copper enzyme maturation permease subunit|nr:ABC transporter permease subunit [Ruminococcus sp.]